MSNFPSSLDNLTDPGPTSKLNSPPHSTQHVNANDAIEKIEAKVGVNGSAVTSTHDYKLSGVTGTDKAASLSGEETLRNKRIVQTITELAPGANATQNLDLTLGNVFVITMPAGDLTLTVSNEIVGQYFSVEIINATSQGALTWFSTINWVDGVEGVLIGVNAKKDSFVFRVTAADTYDGYPVGGNI